MVTAKFPINCTYVPLIYVLRGYDTEEGFVALFIDVDAIGGGCSR